MVSTRKERQSNRRLLTQLDDFDEDLNIGNTMSDRQENTTVNESTAKREYTVGNSDGATAVNENVVNLETLERCFKEKKMGNFVDTVERRFQNATLTAIESNNTPKIELAIVQQNHLLNEMRPVIRQVQNVGKI